MSTVIYTPPARPLQGEIQVPASKSAAHRAILCAALSGGSSEISRLELNDDIRATINAVRTLGTDAVYDSEKKTLRLSSGTEENQETVLLDCRESGSTLRFLIPIAAALGKPCAFTGSGRLPQRPLSVYQDLLPEHGVQLCRQSKDELPLTLRGQLQPGIFRLPGNISSQFITGLLFALPLLPGDSRILLSSPLESESYVTLTLQILRDFGIIICPDSNGWVIPGRQSYQARDYAVEGDWSQAAFFLSMAAFSGERITLTGLREDSVQGDRACMEIYRSFGLQIEQAGGLVTAKNPQTDLPFHGLHAVSIDAAQIPDLVPALAVCAAGCRGVTVIHHAERLRLKECDRLAAMAEAIGRLGGQAEETADGLKITGAERLHGGTVRGMNDHRVVMSLASAVLFSEEPVHVTDAWSIRKSYPDFYKDYKQLGGNADVIDMG